MFNLFNTAPRPVPSLTPADAVARAAQGDLTLIDIRSPAEVAATGKAKGALTIPMVALRMKADPASPECHPDLHVDASIAIYCASGARSQMALQMMQQMGYGDVHNLGGLHHWTMAGGETQRA